MTCKILNYPSFFDLFLPVRTLFVPLNVRVNLYVIVELFFRVKYLLTVMTLKHHIVTRVLH